ncbi:hypothetical protein IKF81_03080 [Candidatus Saccharibacteria bacterium]|nr:hypothetical protein [Candidatus Saccharibacteria bacterium]
MGNRVKIAVLGLVFGVFAIFGGVFTEKASALTISEAQNACKTLKGSSFKSTDFTYKNENGKKVYVCSRIEPNQAQECGNTNNGQYHDNACHWSAETETSGSGSGSSDGANGGSSAGGGSETKDDDGRCGDGGVKTSILGKDGCYEGGVADILATILTIMTFGVGAAGVLGIVIAGIQYMTAGGNEMQMTKAKNRIVQVVIGLVGYGLLWALLEWLIPGGIL